EVGELFTLQVPVIPVAVDYAGCAARDDQISGVAPAYRQIVRVGEAEQAIERRQCLGYAWIVPLGPAGPQPAIAFSAELAHEHCLKDVCGVAWLTLANRDQRN